MSTSGGANVANLDVVISAPGIAQTRNDAVGALRDMSAAANENAKSVDANRAAYQKWQQQQSGSSRQLADMQSAMQATVDAINRLTAAVSGNTAAFESSGGAAARAGRAARDPRAHHRPPAALAPRRRAGAGQGR